MSPALGMKQKLTDESGSKNLEILLVIPGDINLPTGGYRYDRAMVHEWKNSGHSVSILSLPGDYPFPEQYDKLTALQMASELQDFDHCIVDGLAGGAHPELLKQLSLKGAVTALIHHPLCLESGLNDKLALLLEKSESEGLKFATGIITTSPETARTVKGLFNIDQTPIDHVLPGTQRNKPSNRSETNELKLLCVGSVIERKGHVYLIRALAKLTHLEWHLDCVGKADLDPVLFEQLSNLLHSCSLDERVIFHGAIDEAALAKLYAEADLFVLPSLYEGYGMAYAEAIAHGLPIIGTAAGAIPDTVPEGCGILVEPGNVQALSEALNNMICNSTLRDRYRSGALKASSEQPTWEESANRFLQILEQRA